MAPIALAVFHSQVTRVVDVIIPALNEGTKLPHLLEDLRQVALPIAVTVVDGGSRDDTVAVARAGGARVVCSRRGRAMQMNVGARAATAEWLCFLHADVRLPTAARNDLVRTVTQSQADVAVWRLAIDGAGWWLRTVEYGAWLRDRLAGFPYGDQGLLVRRTLFEQLGGFPDLPVFEDVALFRTLKRATPILRLTSPVIVCGRRWENEGAYHTWLRNSALLVAYLVGASPHRLAKWYRPHDA